MDVVFQRNQKIDQISTQQTNGCKMIPDEILSACVWNKNKDFVFCTPDVRIQRD